MLSFVEWIMLANRQIPNGSNIRTISSQLFSAKIQRNGCANVFTSILNISQRIYFHKKVFVQISKKIFISFFCPSSLNLMLSFFNSSPAKQQTKALPKDMKSSKTFARNNFRWQTFWATKISANTFLYLIIFYKRQNAFFCENFAKRNFSKQNLSGVFLSEKNFRE